MPVVYLENVFNKIGRVEISEVISLVDQSGDQPKLATDALINQRTCEFIVQSLFYYWNGGLYEGEHASTAFLNRQKEILALIQSFKKFYSPAEVLDQLPIPGLSRFLPKDKS